MVMGTSPPASRKPPRRIGSLDGAAALEGASFDALFRECAEDVHGYLISLLGDRSAAQDATALAFERLYRARSRIDSARGSARALLFAIARNAALDELRRRSRERAFVVAYDAPVEAPAVDAFGDAERRATVCGALASLPLRERELVLLKFYGQLSNRELAHAMGTSESNVGTRLHRALGTLRARCADAGEEQVA